jgi:hypothetical protein
VDSKVETDNQAKDVELIKFTVKAQLAAAPGGAGGSPAAR